MGKYTHLKDALEPLPQDQTWQQKINVVKGKFSETHLGNLGEAYNAARLRKQKLDDELGQVNTEIEALSQLIISRLEDEGMTLVRLSDGSTLYINDKPYCQVQDRARFLEWIRETGREDLLTVNYQTMNSMTGELLLDGQEPPPGIKAWLKTTLSRRR